MTLALLLGLAHAADTVTLLHTNDWQSRLLGVPNRDYTPGTVGDDDTLGGVARLATLAQQRRGEGPTFLLDAGDITMGSLFHLVSREQAGELRLMHLIGFDGAALGNHDFDFRPAGLAEMIRSAQVRGGLPALLASNLVLDPSDPRDDGLEALVAEGLLMDRLLIERQGVTIGLIGLLGRDATEVMGQADPVTTSDAIEVSTRLAAELRDVGADLIVALSHSGVSRMDDGSWGDEDVDLMRGVPGLDVVISGHSHTLLEEPILVDGRPVVQAGANIQHLGELVMERDGERWAFKSYTVHPLDDSIPGDPAAMALVQQLKEAVGLELFEGQVATVSRRMTRDQDDHALGNLVTSAFREAVGADLGVTGNGTLRSDLDPGALMRSDLFLVTPLGIGTLDDSAGYALVKAWLTGEDLKAVLEFLVFGYVLKGDSYYPRISGGDVEVNPRRLPMDQVVGVVFADGSEAELDSEHMYSVAMSTYVASFLPVVRETTHGLLDATLRDADGNPATVEELVFDGDPQRAGVQELKTYAAVASYVERNPVLPVDEAAHLIERPSMKLLRNSTWKQRTAMGLPLGLLLGVVGLVARRLRR